MPVILSFAFDGHALFAAGPEGLFRVEGGALVEQPQPMESLYCVASACGALLVGGAPHGVAFQQPSGDWQAGWMDHTQAPALSIAPAPDVEQSGVILAATAGDGLLRTTNRGITWSLCNFGLREFTLLCVAWAPPPAACWPARDIVFCGGEHGLYRSPAAGLGWSQVDGIAAAVQTISVSPRFHADGLVLAGTEGSGLWRSADGGRSFAPVAGLPSRIDALSSTRQGWFAATPDGLYHSDDSLGWSNLAGSPSALCMIETADGLDYGGESGFGRLDLDMLLAVAPSRN